MKNNVLRRAITTLALVAAAATTSLTGASPAHADVWPGGEHGSLNVNCYSGTHTMTVNVMMTPYTPMPTDQYDRSILTPAPTPSYHRLWLYSAATRTWVHHTDWTYTPGSRQVTITMPGGYYHVYVEYAWALRNNPTGAASDWLMAHEYVMDDYSYFPYLSGTPRGWCLV